MRTPAKQLLRRNMRGNRHIIKNERFFRLPDIFPFLCYLLLLSPLTATAEKAPGNAPFINTWLLAGPFDQPVADQIYGIDSIPRPEDGNWAVLASVTASSVWQSGGEGYPVKNADASSPSFAIDGKMETDWISQMHDTNGNPDSWPSWDPTPTLYLDWDTPIKVKEIQVFDRHNPSWKDHTSNVEKVICTLKDKKGKTLDSTTITHIDPTGATPGKAVFPQPVSDVSRVELLIVHDGKKAGHNVGLGFKEVKVFDGTPVEIDKIYSGSPKKITDLMATVSSTLDNETANSADKALDDDTETAWKAQCKQGLPPWDGNIGMDIRLPEISLVTSLDITPYVLEQNKKFTLEYTLLNSSGKILKKGKLDTVTGNREDKQQIRFEEGIKHVDVVRIRLSEKEGGGNHYGLREVEIYGIPKKSEESAKPNHKITPVSGREFGLSRTGAQKHKWKYLDDRLWNRSYDDYQDLYGYYKVKQNIDTRNKYVYAHAYVYSPRECAAHLRTGASGSYRLFFNDRLVNGPTVPAEVKKDLTIHRIKLKAGWNKILLQIRHTFTEDVNSNGIPIGKDFHVAYLGFYGRITDPTGNSIADLAYSLSGDQPEKLTIDTHALDLEKNSPKNSLPNHTMPAAYTEWPYVWNDSPSSNAGHTVSASPFQFMAGGGRPGYTWSLASGELPAGLKLNPNGTIAGFTGSPPGQYDFSVKVSDSAGESATKDFSIQVKERPNKWFEEGRVGALSHCIPIVNYFVDENYSADLWAERARRQGHSLVSIESLQQNYYWPSKFADPAHPRQQYLPKQADGRVVDGLRQYEQALRRYGIKFGLYYATEGGGLQHFSTDVFFQNVEDLIRTYHPDYLYFDGPQTMPSANYDVMYSLIRNYSDKIIANSNTNSGWGGAFGDADLRTVEASHIYAGASNNIYTKRTIMEPWKSVASKHNPTPYYSKRDDFRQIAREMVMNAGRGMVDNNDQMPVMSRGTNWDTPEDVARRYPIAVQEYIDIREGLAAWFSPIGKSERHESTTGTHPFFVAGCGYEDDGKGNIPQFESGHGPAWGYAVTRDNNIYLHILKGPDGKKGFDAINGKVLTLSPVSDKVEKVIWLNEDKEIGNFKQEGNNLSINLSDISEDPVDTIVKIVTNKTAKKYKLTHLYVTGRHISPSLLQIQTEGYMTYPALKAGLDKISFRSDNTRVASVNKNGLVKAVSDGLAHITITGISGSMEQTEKLPVKVSGGKIRIHDPLIGVVIKVDNKEIYHRITAADKPHVTIEGRSRRGGPTGLHSAKITYYTGIVDLQAGTREKPVKIRDTQPRQFPDGKIIFEKVKEKTRIAVWAEVELDGQKMTSNKVFLDLEPWQNLAKKSKITSSPYKKGYDPEKLIDGDTINGTSQDESRWSVSGSTPSWVAFDLGKPAEVRHVEIHFNTLEQKFHNVPKTLEIQTSTNGINWKTEKSVTPPRESATACFGIPEIYNFDTPVRTRYIRFHFPEGSANDCLDLLEAVIAGQP